MEIRYLVSEILLIGLACLFYLTINTSDNIEFTIYLVIFLLFGGFYVFNYRKLFKKLCLIKE